MEAEAASTSEVKTSIVIPKAILHDHPYFSFSEVPKQGDHEYGGHCVVQFTNFNSSAQFGDGMTPNMMITSVPPASIFEGDSDPDSSDDPHQNLVQLTKADLTRASQMQRDPSLRTSRRENKGKTSKYKDEEVDLFNNRRKTPQKKIVVPVKEKAQPITPKSPSDQQQESNKTPKKGQNKGKKANKKAEEQNASEETTVIEEAMEVDDVPLIEEAKRNGEQEKDTPKTKSTTPAKRSRKASNRATNEKDKTEESVPVSVKEEENNGTSPQKVDEVEEENLSKSPTKQKSPATAQKSPAKRLRGRPKKSDGEEKGEDEEKEEEEEQKKEEPPAKKRRGSTRKTEEEAKNKAEKPEKKTSTPVRGRRGAAAAETTTTENEAPPGRKTRQNNSQAVETPAKAKPAKKNARSPKGSASKTKKEVEAEVEKAEVEMAEVEIAEVEKEEVEKEEVEKEEVEMTEVEETEVEEAEVEKAEVEETPTNKQTSRTPRNKKAGTIPKSKAKKKKEVVEKEVVAPITFTPCDIAAAEDPWGKAIPMELLTRIFIIIKQDIGLLPFVSRMSQVCKLWYEATKHPNLWHKVDLSNDIIKKYKKSFHWLCKNRLQQTSALNLSGWESLRQADIQVLANNAKELENLDLSGCNKLGFDSLQTLIDKLDKLHSISLARTWTQMVLNKPLVYLMEKKGAQLKKLDLSENSFTKFETSLRSLIKHCPNLEYVNLNNCLFSTQMFTLPLTKLQTSCPKIKVLLMAQSLFKLQDASAREQRECPGFTQLETLNIGRSTVGRMGKFKTVTDDILCKFAKNAEGLKVLDVSGCLHITAKGLSVLPAKNVEKLYMSQCKAASQQDFLDVLLNWSHSMKELDLSGNSMEPAHLKKILETCTNLSFIDVNGCRGLPWAMRKGYNGSGLKGLMSELNTLIKDASGTI